MGAKVEFRYRYDWGYLLQATQRIRRRSRARVLVVAVKTFLTILLLILAGVTFVRALGVSLFFLALIILMLNAHRIDYWRLRREFSESPWFNEVVVVTLSAEGLQIVTPQSNSHLKWSVLTKARSFPDGILLQEGTCIAVWLPDSAQVSGIQADVEALVRAHVSDYGNAHPDS